MRGNLEKLAARFTNREVCSVNALLYHDVSDGSAGGFPSLTVSPRQFEQHLRWLCRLGVRTITPRQYADMRAGRAEYAGPAVIVTFDDAYASLVRTALPALKRYGLSAAIYVVSNEIGGINRWDLHRGSPPIQLMGPEEIHYWSRQGFEFGAHTRSHRDLTTLNDEELEGELIGSKRVLEQLTPYPVTSFAYPYGLLDDRVAVAVSRHFETAFSTLEGINTDDTDVKRLRRTPVSSLESNLEFLSRAFFARNRLNVPRRIAGRAKRFVLSSSVLR